MSEDLKDRKELAHMSNGIAVVGSRQRDLGMKKSAVRKFWHGKNNAAIPYSSPQTGRLGSFQTVYRGALVH